jgi:hypothetical protein
MRYRLAVSMLLMLLLGLPAIYLPAASGPELPAMLSAINLPAAPAPDPLGILDIGQPPKYRTAEQHLKFEIEFNTSQDILNKVSSDPEVRKLPSVASIKDARPWLAKNLRVKPQGGGRLLHFTSRDGKRNEQATIINAFLRANLHWHDLGGRSIKRLEDHLRWTEDRILDLEKRIESGQYPNMIDKYREAINSTRYTGIPLIRAEIARLKQYGVVRWAR